MSAASPAAFEVFTDGSDHASSKLVREMMTTSPALEISTSRPFTNWMQEQTLSQGFTTYQAGKLFLLGLQRDSRLSVFERTFNRCLGLWANGQPMWMTSLYQWAA